MFFHWSNVWFKTVDDTHSNKSFFQSRHLMWLPTCSNINSSAQRNVGLLLYEIRVILKSIKLFNFSSCQIIPYIQQLGQKWLVTISNFQIGWQFSTLASVQKDILWALNILP